MSTFFDLDRDQLETYRPDSFEPADFDEFWATTLEENPFDPRSVQIEEVTDLVVKTHRVFDVTFGGYAGDPIKAWLTIPATAQPGEELPTIVEFRGYGGGRVRETPPFQQKPRHLNEVAG
ncbi:MAG: acetylxylan esterase [Schaalia turicensis]